MKIMQCIYTKEHCSAIKKNENLSFAVKVVEEYRVK
jgi:hypothetical protein